MTSSIHIMNVISGPLLSSPVAALEEARIVCYGLTSEDVCWWKPSWEERGNHINGQYAL